MKKKCSEVILFDFIKVIVHNDPEVIGLTQSEWMELYSEYMQLVSDPKHSHLLRLIKDAAIYEVKHARIKGLIRLLRQGYDEDLAGMLKKHGYFLNYNEETCFKDWEKYQKDLNLIESKAKVVLLQLTKSIQDLEDFQKESEKEQGAPVTENSFLVLLTDLSKYQGYRLDWNEITVAEFVSVFNRFKQHIEQQRKNK